MVEWWTENTAVTDLNALNDLIYTASQCDGWESFPHEALQKAEAVI